MTTAEQTEEDKDKDINDVFDDILFSQEQIIKESYQEGYSKSLSEDNKEGYHLGYHRGAEIGAELGYYLGFVESYVTEEQKSNFSEKVLQHTQVLVDLIRKFPTCNSEENILDMVEKIRTLFKKICSLLKIDAFYPEVDELSF